MHEVELADLLWFAGWLGALALLFCLALRLPLQTGLSRPLAQIYAAAVVVVIFAVAVLANFALSLHDTHIDLTREKVFTPSERALEVVDRISEPVKLTYFFQGQDPNGQRARDIVEAMGRRNALLDVRTVDPDRQPTLAENFGVKVYNTAVLEADGRRITVGSTDESEIAIGIQRVLRERIVTICFIEGHGEYPIDNFEFHTHFEGVAGHSHGESDSAVILTEGHGVGRMRRALEGIGYDVRKVTPASEGDLPPDCAVVVDAGPRTTYLPAETAALEAYLRQGGSLLLMYDLGFVLEPGLEQLMQTLGVRLPQAVVIDPKSHYGTDPEMVAVTTYDPHPITRHVSFTFYPGARALELVPPAPGIQVLPLVSSSAASHTMPVAAVAQRQLEPAPLADAALSPTMPGAQVLAAVSEGTLRPSGTRPFRAIVIGDSDFASNSFFPYVANSDLALAMVRFLARDEHATPIASRVPAPPQVLLTKAQMQSIFLLLVVLLPLSVIALGGVVWWRRR
ncbi:MAG TPA: GldG family protein [Vicinamibacterales bacterium]|nr:GldG family protein [Vicinamibacterales bacterium]